MKSNIHPLQPVLDVIEGIRNDVAALHGVGATHKTRIASINARLDAASKSISTYMAAAPVTKSAAALAAAPVILGPETAEIAYEQDSTIRVLATNNPVVYSTSDLPAGLKQDPNSGVISGRPVVRGVYTIQLHAKNAAGTGSASLVLTID